MARSKGTAAGGGAAAKSKSAPAAARRANTSTRMLVMMATGAIVAIAAGYFFRQFNLWSSAPSATSSATAAQSQSADDLAALEAGRYNVTCLDEYPLVGACSPPSSCARIIIDDFLSAKEVATLRQMSELGMSFGSGSGGPTIFDVASGAASKGSEFVDAYALMSKRQSSALASGASADVASSAPIFSAEQVELYRTTTARVRSLAESQLGVRGLALTSPSFFSRISSAPARTAHDEYWHEHVDKKQYGSFAYTALLYLSEQGREFRGGSFVFVDKDSLGKRSEVRAVPKAGRLVMFTSGVENVHYVSRVTSGVRHALTIAFTCDASKSVEAKLLARADDMLRKQALAQARAAQTAASETNSQPPSTQEPATPVAGDAAPPARP